MNEVSLSAPMPGAGDHVRSMPRGPDRIHCKAALPLPQRQRALPLHALAVDHRGGTGCRRLPGTHDQRGPRAVIGQRAG
jgi:hypothetical protein